MKNAAIVAGSAWLAYWLYMQGTTGGDVNRKPNGETGATVAAIGAAIATMVIK